MMKELKISNERGAGSGQGRFIAKAASESQQAPELNCGDASPPRHPFSEPGKGEPCRWNSASPEDIQMQRFWETTAGALAKPPFGHPSLQTGQPCHHGPCCIWDLCAGPAMGCRTPKAAPGTAWDGGGGDWDHGDQQQLGITLEMRPGHVWSSEH